MVKKILLSALLLFCALQFFRPRFGNLPSDKKVAAEKLGMIDPTYSSVVDSNGFGAFVPVASQLGWSA